MVAVVEMERLATVEKDNVMQYGPRILYGAGCPQTNNGQHLVEFNETGTDAWCCQCGLELTDLERRKAFMALPINERRELMKASAEKFTDAGGYDPD